MVDYWRDTIVVFGRDGSLRRELGGPGNEKGRFSSPAGIALATDGSIFVADFYGHRIQQLSADGTFVRQWGVTGEASSGAGMFSYPSDVALAPDGSIIIADGYNDRVQVFKPDGQFLNKWGGPFAANIHGPFNGWFATVTSVAVDRDGTIFAADFYNNRIQKIFAGRQVSYIFRLDWSG